MTISLLSVEDLAAVIHKSPASVRSDASRNPSALPPICRLPGNKRLLWRLVDVQNWLAGCVEKSSPLESSVEEINGPKKRGRPRKVQLRSVA